MIRFGTDGWRGIIGQDFTVEAVTLAARGFARYLKRGQGISLSPGPAPIVVGYDTRLRSKEFAEVAAEALASEGFDVLLASRFAPTPAIASALVAQGAGGGVIITASHNPPQYNGFKVRDERGASPPSSVTSAIEEEIERLRWPSVISHQPSATGRITLFDPIPLHLDRLARLVDLRTIASSGFQIVIDPMYGAGQGFLFHLLQGIGLKTEEVHGEVDPSFGGGNPEPMASNLGELSSKIRSLPGWRKVGLAFDGDADRLGAVEEEGRFVTPHHIFALLLKHLKEHRGLSGTVVKTFSVTRMVDRLASHYGLPLRETPIGFKYIAEVMLKEQILIGGEESGGIGIIDHIPERDAFLAALLLLQLLAVTGKPLGRLIQELEEELGPHRYHRLDLHIEQGLIRERLNALKKAPPERVSIFRLEEVRTLDGVKLLFEGGAWLLLRPSGTEPVIRLYAEAQREEEVQDLLQWGKAFILKA